MNYMHQLLMKSMLKPDFSNLKNNGKLEDHELTWSLIAWHLLINRNVSSTVLLRWGHDWAWARFTLVGNSRVRKSDIITSIDRVLWRRLLLIGIRHSFEINNNGHYVFDLVYSGDWIWQSHGSIWLQSTIKPSDFICPGKLLFLRMFGELPW